MIFALPVSDVRVLLLIISHDIMEPPHLPNFTAVDITPARHVEFVLSLVPVVLNQTLFGRFTLYDLKTSKRYQSPRDRTFGEVDGPETARNWNIVIQQLQQCTIVYTSQDDTYSASCAYFNGVNFVLAPEGDQAIGDLRKELIDANKMIIHLSSSMFLCLRYRAQC
jgi:hypothetical protein